MVGVGVPSRIEITVMIVVMVMASGEIISAESQLGEWNALRTGKLDLLTDIYALEAHSPVDTFS